MATYERINWENSPSVSTPVNADNLNNMDEGIASLYEEVESLRNEDLTDISDAINILTVRLNTIIAVPSNATEGNAELIDIRVAADGTIYPTAGVAVRTQISSIINRLNALEAH